MKRITLLLAVATLFSIFYTTNVQAQLTETEDKFIQTITKDFKDTHSISLSSYDFFDITEIYSDKDNLTSQEKSLINIAKDIAKTQSFVDLSPLFFIDKVNKKGYVLQKQLSGMNILHSISYDNTSQSWQVTNKVNKMGKDIDDLGLLQGTK